MHQCPSCKNHTISYGAAWNASFKHPTLCPACGELSFVPSPQSHGPFGAALLLIIASGVVAALAQSLPLFVGGVTLALIYYIARWRRKKKLVVFDPLVLVQEQARWGPYILLESIAAIFAFQ